MGCRGQKWEIKLSGKYLNEFDKLVVQVKKRSTWTFAQHKLQTAVGLSSFKIAVSKLENLHLALLFKLSGSARVQQFDVASPTTVCLLFFTVYVVFSPQIGSHTSNISNLSVPAHQLYIPVCWKYIFPPCAISSLRKSRLWCLRSVGRCVRRPVNLQQSQKSSYFFLQRQQLSPRNS